jgi:hypothetical protein
MGWRLAVGRGNSVIVAACAAPAEAARATIVADRRRLAEGMMRLSA